MATRSRGLGLQIAEGWESIASGVLCAISDGVLFDDQFTMASSAIARATDGERPILSELDK